MSSTLMMCPITYFEDNFYFNNAKSCWAAYKLGGSNYDFQSVDAKINIMLGLVQTLKNVAHVKIFVVPTTEDVETHYSRGKQRLRQDDILYDSAIDFTNRTCTHLKETGQSWNDYSTYVVIKLVEEAIDEVALMGKQILNYMKAPLINSTAKFLLEPEDITAVAYEKFKKIEDDIFQTLCGYIELERLKSSATQWLLKRINFKGLKQPVKLNKVLSITFDELTQKQKKEYTEEWTPHKELIQKDKVEYYRPNKHDVANLFSGRLRHDGRKGISVTHDDGASSYQSYLVLTNFPEETRFPDKEWIYQIQKQPVQVEICIDVDNIPYQRALDDLKKKRREVMTEMENVQKAKQSMPSKLLEAFSQIEALERELGDNKIPMCKTVVSICVAGSDAEIVESDVRKLKTFLDKNDFTAERPGADQFKIYMQHIPGTESQASVFTQKVSPFTIASGVFGVNNRVGDSFGYYIGMANGKPVFVYLGQACLEDKSPAATFYGNLGQGKSFNANLLVFLHVLHGGYGLVICPKGERKKWKDMPLIGKYVNLVELTPDACNKGKLDPYNMFPDDVEHAGELAFNIITDLLRIVDGQVTVLRESINVVKKLQRPSMLKIVKAIESIDSKDPYYNDAVMLSRNLRATMDSGTAKLLFGDGTEEAININGRLNVIMLQGISFPDKDTPKEDYNQEEILASVLMYQVANFSKKFMMLHENIFKIVLIDESWMLKSIAAGSKFIKEAARMGRSQYAAILLNGHSVLDLPSEELQQTITYKFCFKTTSPEEAQRMLKYLHLEETLQNIRTLMNLKNGECLFSDAYGRVSKLKFDAVFEELINFFKTTPEDKKTEKKSTQSAKPQETTQEEKIISDTTPSDEDTNNNIDIFMMKIDELLAREGKRAG